MATALENLITRRDSICAQLAALGSSAGVPDSSKAGSIPDQGGDGINTKHVDYKRSLYQELREIEELIATIAGPSEHISQGAY